MLFKGTIFIGQGKTMKSMLESFASLGNPLSANLTKWSNTLKQFVGNLPRNCLSVFDHFVGFALKVIITELILSFKVSRGAFSLFTSIEKTSFPESFLEVQ